MPNHPKSAAYAFAEAINAHRLDALAELMTEGHTFIDSLGAKTQGKQNMMKAWDGYFGMVPDYTIAVDETFVDGSTVVMLGTAQGTYAPDGKVRAENKWSTPAAWRAKIKGSLVAEWRVYADNEPIRQIMAKKLSKPQPPSS